MIPWRPTVAGLVTAATFWVGAVVGVLCGAGWLSEVAWGTLLTVSVLLLSSLVKRSFISR